MSALPEPISKKKAAPATISPILRTISRSLSRLIDRYQPSANSVLLLTAVVVGSLTGLLAVGLIEAIRLSFKFFYGGVAGVWPGLGRWWIIVLPALGGLLAGPILTRYLPEGRASGIPNVMEALILRNGRIRARVIPLKLLLTSLALGSGGSAGREGPVVQIGASLGSTIAMLLRLSSNRTRNLVACGAAAGIAASFNAPIAGVAFAIEELGGELGLTMLGNVVIAAVSASIVSRSLLPATESFAIPSYQLGHPTLILFFALLGVVTGLWGVVYIKVFYGIGDFFDRLRRLPSWIKPAVGGLLVGLISFIYPLLLNKAGMDADLLRLGTPVVDFIPHIAGVGFDVVEIALRSPLPLLLVFSLLILKLFATSITLGSGAAGGMFAPALFMGAMLGGLFGQVGAQLFPQAGIQPGAFALAGMAGVLTGAVRAPLTSILIVFEMTNDYAFVLPLMATTIISALVAQGLHHESMYSLWLVRRGINAHQGLDVDVLDGVLVREVMDTAPPTIHPQQTCQFLHTMLSVSHHHGVIVIDEENQLLGVATLSDLENVMDAPGWEGRPVETIMTRTVLSVTPDETIGAALQRMAVRDIGRMPVIESEHSRRIVGLVRRTNIVRSYQRGLLRRAEMADRANQLRASRSSGAEFMELSVAPGSVADGALVRELPLPPGVLLTTHVQGDKRHLVHGHDRLQAGDVVLILVEMSAEKATRQLFDPPA